MFHFSFSFKIKLQHSNKQFCRVYTWMFFLLYVSLFIFFQIEIKQKAVLQSVHLNAFSPVCFILHFFQIRITTKSSFACRLCTWMLFPLYVSLFIFFQSKIKQKAVLQSAHLNAFSPCVFKQKAALQSVHLNAFFPCVYHSSFSFKLELQQKAVLQSVHLNAFSPVCFTLHFLSN